MRSGSSRAGWRRRCARGASPRCRCCSGGISRRRVVSPGLLQAEVFVRERYPGRPAPRMAHHGGGPGPHASQRGQGVQVQVILAVRHKCPAQAAQGLPASARAWGNWLSSQRGQSCGCGKGPGESDRVDTAVATARRAMTCSLAACRADLLADNSPGPRPRTGDQWPGRSNAGARPAAVGARLRVAGPVRPHGLRPGWHPDRTCAGPAQPRASTGCDRAIAGQAAGRGRRDGAHLEAGGAAGQ